MQIRRSDHTRARRHRRTSWTCFLRKGWRSHYHPSLAVTAFLWIDSLREGKLGAPNPSRRCHIPMMIDDNLLPFWLPAVRRKKITAAFDGGRLSSDGGVMLLALAERRIEIADKLAAEPGDRVLLSLENCGEVFEL